MIITLTGFMGVGKSTIAERCSKLLLSTYYDLDKEIENSEGMIISEIFNLKGENYFRDLEEKTLYNLFQIEDKNILIISLGGGALLSHKNLELVKSKSTCIYLRAEIETIKKRLERGKKSRPLLQEINIENESNNLIHEFFTVREGGYLNAASIIIDVDDKNIDEIVNEVISSI